MNVAVAGLGSMGGGMAASLLRKGFAVSGVDANAERTAALVPAGLIAANSPAEASRDAAALVISVVNAEQTEAVLFGAGGAADALSGGAVVIATSTVPAAFAEALESRLRDRGILMLDAPVSGGAVKAEAGELSVLASGEPRAFAAARDVLHAIAATVYELGERAGAGSRMKSINQLLAGVHIAAACEALTFAVRLGIDPAQAYDVIARSAGNSWMFENRMPHVLAGDYAPRSAVDIFVKDLGIVLDQGRGASFPLPMAAAAHQLYLAASAMGFGRDDDASLARVYAALGAVRLP